MHARLCMLRLIRHAPSNLAASRYRDSDRVEMIAAHHARFLSGRQDADGWDAGKVADPGSFWAHLVSSLL